MVLKRTVTVCKEPYLFNVSYEMNNIIRVFNLDHLDRTCVIYKQ